MASKSFSEENSSCPVCFNIYKDPLILTCTHSICNTCLQQFWKAKGSRECPICRRRCSKEMYPLNRVLKDLCETFQQESSQREPFCSLHRSELKLFCEDDKQLVGSVCRDSKPQLQFPQWSSTSCFRQPFPLSNKGPICYLVLNPPCIACYYCTESFISIWDD